MSEILTTQIEDKVAILTLNDAKESRAAFVEKRKPSYTGT